MADMSRKSSERSKVETRGALKGESTQGSDFPKNDNSKCPEQQTDIKTIHQPTGNRGTSYRLIGQRANPNHEGQDQIYSCNCSQHTASGLPQAPNLPLKKNKLQSPKVSSADIQIRKEPSEKLEVMSGEKGTENYRTQDPKAYDRTNESLNITQVQESVVQSSVNSQNAFSSIDSGLSQAPNLPLKKNKLQSPKVSSAEIQIRNKPSENLEVMSGEKGTENYRTQDPKAYDRTKESLNNTPVQESVVQSSMNSQNASSSIDSGLSQAQNLSLEKNKLQSPKVSSAEIQIKKEPLENLEVMSGEKEKEKHGTQVQKAYDATKESFNDTQEIVIQSSVNSQNVSSSIDSGLSQARNTSLDESQLRNVFSADIQIKKEMLENNEAMSGEQGKEKHVIQGQKAYDGTKESLNNAQVQESKFQSSVNSQNASSLIDSGTSVNKDVSNPECVKTGENSVGKEEKKKRKKKEICSEDFDGMPIDEEVFTFLKYLLKNAHVSCDIKIRTNDKVIEICFGQERDKQIHNFFLKENFPHAVFENNGTFSPFIDTEKGRKILDKLKVSFGNFVIKETDEKLHLIGNHNTWIELNNEFQNLVQNFNTIDSQELLLSSRKKYTLLFQSLLESDTTLKTKLSITFGNNYSFQIQSGKRISVRAPCAMIDEIKSIVNQNIQDYTIRVLDEKIFQSAVCEEGQIVLKKFTENNDVIFKLIPGHRIAQNSKPYNQRKFTSKTLFEEIVIKMKDGKQIVILNDNANYTWFKKINRLQLGNGNTKNQWDICFQKFTTEAAALYNQLVEKITTCLDHAKKDKIIAFLADFTTIKTENVQPYMQSMKAYKYLCRCFLQNTGFPKVVYMLSEDNSKLQSQLMEAFGSMVDAVILRDHEELAQPAKIKIKTGTIAEFKGNAVVNTTSKELKLDKGAVSISLLETAGYQMQDDLKTQYKDGLSSEDDIAVTPGYALPCEYVFHGAIKKFKDAQNAKGIEEMVKKCLLYGTYLNLESIAFPAVGTGMLNYPSDIVAGTMFRAVNAFCVSYPETPLKSIYFIICPGDDKVLQVFKKKEDEYMQCVKTRRLSDGDEKPEYLIAARSDTIMSKVLQEIDKLSKGISDKAPQGPDRKTRFLKEKKPKLKILIEVKDTKILQDALNDMKEINIADTIVCPFLQDNQALVILSDFKEENFFTTCEKYDGELKTTKMDQNLVNTKAKVKEKHKEKLQDIPDLEKYLLEESGAEIENTNGEMFVKGSSMEIEMAFNVLSRMLKNKLAYKSITTKQTNVADPMKIEIKSLSDKEKSILKNTKEINARFQVDVELDMVKNKIIISGNDHERVNLACEEIKIIIGRKTLTLETSENLRITIYQGTFSDVQTDCVLSPIVSKLQTNLNSLYLNTPQGRIQTCKIKKSNEKCYFVQGLNANQCRIIHAQFDDLSKKNDKKENRCTKLSNVLLNSLVMADKNGCKSITIPWPITGAHHMNGDIGNEACLWGLAFFLKEKKTNLTDVHFMTSNLNEAESAYNKLARIKSCNVNQKDPPHCQFDNADEYDFSKNSIAFKIYQQIRVEISAENMNIDSQEVPKRAFVCYESKHFDFHKYRTYSVAAQLKKFIEKNAIIFENETCEIGSTIKTTGPNGPLIFAIVPDIKLPELDENNKKHLKTCVSNILRNYKIFESLILPFVASDYGSQFDQGTPLKILVDIYCECLTEFAKQNTDSCLKRIHLYVGKNKYLTLKEFEKALKTKIWWSDLDSN